MLELTKLARKQGKIPQNGFISCYASFPHYAFTPKYQVYYAITHKNRLDYALRHYALHFPHYAITQKYRANYALRHQKWAYYAITQTYNPPPIRVHTKVSLVED